MPERLNVVATLDGMANALPKQKLGDDLADLASPYEAISLLIHSYMKALGFTLTGSDQDMELCESFSPPTCCSLLIQPTTQLRQNPSPLAYRYNGSLASDPWPSHIHISSHP